MQGAYGAGFPLRGLSSRILYMYPPWFHVSLIYGLPSFPHPSPSASQRPVDDVPPPLRPPGCRSFLLCSLRGCCDGLVGWRLYHCHEGGIRLRRLGFRTPEVPDCPCTKYGDGWEVSPELHHRGILYACPPLARSHPRVDVDHFLTVESMHNFVEEGDIVIIEFGHFEGGGPMGSIRHNVLCPGLDPIVTCERYVGDLGFSSTPDRKDTNPVLIIPPLPLTVMMAKCSTPSSSEFGPRACRLFRM